MKLYRVLTPSSVFYAVKEKIDLKKAEGRRQEAGGRRLL
jgi:hypothetical protein